MATLVIGLLMGFFLGRTYESSSTDGASAPLTLPPSPSTTRPPGDTVPQRAPEPTTSAPPGTELDPATIGSFDDPIPVGQAYVLGLYQIEVTGADRDAGPALAAFDAANPAPPEGQQHVLVELTITASGFGSPASIPFFVSDGTGQWFAFESSCGRIPSDLADVGFVDAGDEVTGQVCFTVPSDAVEQLVFGTEGIAAPLYFALPD